MRGEQHQLKVWPEPFDALADGTKLFEFRKDERSYRVGDELVLDEWDPDDERYTGRSLRRTITYLLRGPAFGIPQGFICLSLAAARPVLPPADTGESTMQNKHARGLYRKFDVRRTDGSDASGGKHDGCNYFVLDVTHDPHSDAALLAYANSCEGEYPALADDLRDLLSQSRPLAVLPIVGPADTGAIESEQVQLLAWAVSNCHTLARRELNRLRPYINLNKLAIERWEHVQRICEKAGAQSKGVLRAALPTEITDGEEPAALPVLPPADTGEAAPQMTFSRALVRRVAAYVRGFIVPPPAFHLGPCDWRLLQHVADMIEAQEHALIQSTALPLVTPQEQEDRTTTKR